MFSSFFIRRSDEQEQSDCDEDIDDQTSQAADIPARIEMEIMLLENEKKV